MELKKIVEKYISDRNSYIKPTYNETQLRNDFIDPLLKCLGWDVDNEKNKTYFLRDVIQEEYIDIKDEKTKKNPDYTLRINGTRKLFVEVKKPSVNILESAKSAFQTKRYGWSANLGISVLTNFEHIIIYDCRQKPEKTDHANVARYKVYSYEEYVQKIDEISSIISFDAADKGKIDELNVTDTRETETFDGYFLDQIERWREKLAETAIKKNKNLDEKRVNYVIQRLLNRIIFLRICEDRTIEQYETIRRIKDYNELKKLFQKADKKFNSGLFNFIEDIESLNVDIDSSVLIEIFNELYYPQSPYDFSVVDPAILSQIYERFLGKKITVDENRNVELTDVPEVSASNGVVPTPKLIVEQIVQETLKPLIKNKDFNELCNIKIADICCGSGTFLISAYEFLLREMIEKAIFEGITDPKLVYKQDGGDLSLTLKGKKSIIENNLFGVDINPYAVEVAEFSLLLKLLEGETEASINNFIHQNLEKVLPSLKSNIKCGNSLLDSNFLDFMPDAMDNDEILLRVKTFDWKDEFEDIMSQGGFDAIVGNPPYVRIQNMKKYSPEEIQYYQSSHSIYTVAEKDSTDKYFLFIERACRLLNSNGRLGYIVPHKFFVTKSGEKLRKYITEECQISKVVHFGTTQVFPEKSTYTAILILQLNKMTEFEFKKIGKVSSNSLSSSENIRKYKTEKYHSNPWIFLEPETEAVFEKFRGENFKNLGDIADITVGIQTSADKIFIFSPTEEKDNTFVFKYKEKEYEIEKEICKMAIYDLSFKAFETISGNAQMIFPYTIKNNEAKVIDEETLKSVYPLAWKYLLDNKEVLEKRSLQGKNPKWYQFGRSQSLTKFNDSKKLVWHVLSTSPTYVLDTDNLLFTGGGNGPYYGLINKSNYSLLYFLGVLSHPIIESMVKARASEFRGSYYSHGKQFIEKLPIKKIDFNNHIEVELYNSIIKSVENLLETTKKYKDENYNHEAEILNRKRKKLLDKVTNYINKLYQISEKEFEIVKNDEMLATMLGDEE